jgi:predicted transcriptional regulator
MDVAELVEFLDSRRPAEMSKEVFAQHLGLTGAALYYYAKKQRGMRIESLRGMARYFREIGDAEALSVLASYAVDVEGTFTPS